LRPRESGIHLRWSPRVPFRGETINLKRAACRVVEVPAWKPPRTPLDQDTPRFETVDRTTAGDAMGCAGYASDAGVVGGLCTQIDDRVIETGSHFVVANLPRSWVVKQEDGVGVVAQWSRSGGRCDHMPVGPGKAAGQCEHGELSRCPSFHCLLTLTLSNPGGNGPTAIGAGRPTGTPVSDQPGPPSHSPRGTLSEGTPATLPRWGRVRLTDCFR
jgi:hypothetical protein